MMFFQQQLREFEFSFRSDPYITSHISPLLPPPFPPPFFFFFLFSWFCKVTFILGLVASVLDKSNFLSHFFVTWKFCQSSSISSICSDTLAPQNVSFIFGLNLSHSSLSPWCFFMSVWTKEHLTGLGLAL